MRQTAEWRDHIVHEFLKYAAAPGDISSIDYCDSFRSVMMDASTRVSVDCVTFPSCDEALAKWLNGIPDSTYVEIDIPAEAPEKCIAYRKETTLVIVWCNLFADTDELFNRLSKMNLSFTDYTGKKIPSVISEPYRGVPLMPPVAAEIFEKSKAMGHSAPPPSSLIWYPYRSGIQSTSMPMKCSSAMSA